MQATRVILMLVAAACGGGGAAQPAAIDAAPKIDPSSKAAEHVRCPSKTSFAVGVPGHRYSPPTQIVPQGSVVQFTTDADHSAKHQAATGAEPLFFVDFSDVGCVRFNHPGTYKFYCTYHGFTGEVVVQ